MALEGNQGEEMTVNDLFDSLDERLRAQQCPICRIDDWLRVAEAVHVLNYRGGHIVDMQVALAVCNGCRFVRMHMLNPLRDIAAWQEVLG